MASRVLVAMSGGVDSSVAALRLVRAGFDVVGVTLHLWDYPDDGTRGRCCAPEDQYDARRVADHLGIPHYTFDRRELFQQHVVDPFVDAYLAGTTPSPCVACNRSVKLRELLPLADRLGAEAVATGHYARVVPHDDGRPALARGVDRNKDQAYFLHMLRPDELGRLRLPLGDSTKAEVRAEAVEAALPGADKGESQELCFVGPEGYGRFVEARAAGRVRPGPILDDAGRVIGQHEGLHRFTVGQRKGLGVALGKPAFVVGLDAGDGAVRLGDEEALLSRGAALGPDFAWVYPEEAGRVVGYVQVRARHPGAPATLVRAPDGGWTAHFDEPVRAVSPGQIAVAFDAAGRVLGGGTIVRAISVERGAALPMVSP